MVPLVLLLKQALNMRKLGFATATTPYQGGIGSYIVLCMVVVFVDTKLPGLRKEWAEKKLSDNPGRVFLACLRFWGLEFDYQKSAISAKPPAVLTKTPGLSVCRTPPPVMILI